MVFKEFVREWQGLSFPGLAYLTVESYKNYSRKLVQMFEYAELDELPMEDIRSIHVQRVINLAAQVYSPGTVKKYKAILHAIWSCAVRWDVADKNVVDSCTLPRSSGVPVEEVKSWTADQTNLFMHWMINFSDATDQEKLFITLALATGARRGELIALTERDVLEGQIVINKTAYRAGGRQLTKPPKSKQGIRVVSVPPKLVDVIDRYIVFRNMNCGMISPYIFTHKDRPTQMCVDTPSHFFRRIVRAAPVPNITLHGLRHTHASILIAEGVDVAAVAKRLGHSRTSVTLDVYTHSSSLSNGREVAVIKSVLGI